MVWCTWVDGLYLSRIFTFCEMCLPERWRIYESQKLQKHNLMYTTVSMRKVPGCSQKRESMRVKCSGIRSSMMWLPVESQWDQPSQYVAWIRNFKSRYIFCGELRLKIISKYALIGTKWMKLNITPIWK